ncbi:MAG: shikimate dehydrogenase [Eubacteriales bacterium]|nr:shikimate dehydrogenase [Eubacteriales bacterium]
MITGKTRLTGLLGSPVKHSISPLMHNEAFRQLELDYVYLCFETGEEQMEETVRALKTLNVRGFNCTMPVKLRMYELADRLSPAAELIGAVNTVVNDQGILTGHNTDGIGYMSAVKEKGYDIIGKKMTLLGAGGAATAIAVQAALDGVAEIALFNRRGRSWERAQKLTDLLNQKTSCHVTLHDLEDQGAMRLELADSTLLTNATSVGMSPREESSPIADPTVLHERLVVSDVIYNPRETLLMKQAKARNCSTFNGLYMLLYQGAAAFELWTGKQFPLEEIRAKYF